MKKKKKIIIAIVVILMCLVSLIVLYLTNQNEDDATLSISERRWIENNQDKVIDIAILNNIPLFSYASDGLFFEFTEYLEEETNLEFNKVPYNMGSEPSLGNYVYRILNTNEKPTANDIILYEDNYVVISKNSNNIYSLEELHGYNIGVLEEDLSSITNYIGNNITPIFNTFEDATSLFETFEKEELEEEEIVLDLIMIPSNLYLDQILRNNNYNIIFHMNEISKKYVLSLNPEEKTLNSIVTTYYNKWSLETKEESLNEVLYNTYLVNREIDSKAAKDFKSKTYTYGVVKNLPYERVVDEELIGINGEYINKFSDLTNTEFELIEYNTTEELDKAIAQGKVDISYSYFIPSVTEGFDITSLVLPSEYVLLSHEDKNIVVNSLKGLRDIKVHVLKDTYLEKELKENNGVNIKTYNSLTHLLNNINKDNIIMLDSTTYNYYMASKLSDYKVIYRDNLDQGYGFILKRSNDNKVFNDLFINFISTNNYKYIENEGIINLKTDPVKQNYMKLVSRYIVVVLIILILLIKVIVTYFKNKKTAKKLNKEDKIRYTDLLTNLKNRNYLNDSTMKWEENRVFPQAVVVVDLNNIKFINDNFGNAEGDNVIKKAASILINTQLENSEIMRTSGNEFLIYLVGYKEQQIVAYTRKLYKEMKALPHEFGAALGFSMIEDEIKTLDDAINEALLDMRTNKEGQKN